MDQYKQTVSFFALELLYIKFEYYSAYLHIAQQMLN